MTRIGNSLYRALSSFQILFMTLFIPATFISGAMQAYAATSIELRKSGSAYSNSLTVSKGDTVTLEIWADVETDSAKGVEFFISVPRGPFVVVDQSTSIGLQPFNFTGGQFGTQQNNVDSLFSSQIEWLNGAVALGGSSVKTGVGLVATFKLYVVSDTSVSSLISIDDDATHLRDTRYQRITPLPSLSFDTRRNVTIQVDVSTGITDVAGVIRTYELHPNYPNPFNPQTTIRYEVAQAGLATVTVFNLLGQRVATLFEGRLDAGAYQTVWNGRNDAGQPMPSGMYIYRLEAGHFLQSRRMLLLK